jgi:hypothetical protein
VLLRLEKIEEVLPDPAAGANGWRGHVNQATSIGELASRIPVEVSAAVPVTTPAWQFSWSVLLNFGLAKD